MGNDDQNIAGWGLLALALVLALAVVGLLYQWEKSSREPAAEAAPAGSPTAVALSSPTPKPPLQVVEGQAAFRATCAVCHPGGTQSTGPSLLGVKEATFIRQVREGGGGMPAFAPNYLSDDTLKAIFAYLQSLATASPTASPTTGLAAGKALFNQACTFCHPGGKAGVGPSLMGLDKQKFLTVVRQGAGAMPAYKESQLSQQDILNIYEYLQTLSP